MENSKMPVSGNTINVAHYEAFFRKTRASSTREIPTEEALFIKEIVTGIFSIIAAMLLVLKKILKVT